MKTKTRSRMYIALTREGRERSWYPVCHGPCRGSVTERAREIVRRLSLVGDIEANMHRRAIKQHYLQVVSQSCAKREFDIDYNLAESWYAFTPDPEYVRPPIFS